MTIMLSVLLRFTDSDYPFGIFKLFLVLSVGQSIMTFSELQTVMFEVANLNEAQEKLMLMRDIVCVLMTSFSDVHLQAFKQTMGWNREL